MQAFIFEIWFRYGRFDYFLMLYCRFYLYVDGLKFSGWRRRQKGKTNTLGSKQPYKKQKQVSNFGAMPNDHCWDRLLLF